MVRFVVAVGALALVLSACGFGETEEPQATVTAPDVATAEAAPVDPGEAPDGDASLTLPADVCELFDGIDPAGLMSTAAGAFDGSDDECSVGAADPTEYAQASISIGNSAAMVVFRDSYESPVYGCSVVDIDGLGDEAFSCFGGRASSHVVFAAGEYLVMFSAGNSAAGPPADDVILDAAQQILENMQR
jgi:hypothetical protein